MFLYFGENHKEAADGELFEEAGGEEGGDARGGGSCQEGDQGGGEKEPKDRALLVADEAGGRPEAGGEGQEAVHEEVRTG